MTKHMEYLRQVLRDAWYELEVVASTLDELPPDGPTIGKRTRLKSMRATQAKIFEALGAPVPPHAAGEVICTNCRTIGQPMEIRPGKQVCKDCRSENIYPVMRPKKSPAASQTAPGEEDFWKAHVPVTGTQHDPANGLLHGDCARCRTTWPCQYSPESRIIAPITTQAEIRETALDARIAELERENSALHTSRGTWTQAALEASAKIEALQASAAQETKRLRDALTLAATRLEILTGRMRGCHETTGNHELLDEAVMFCEAARRAALSRPAEGET